MSEFIDNLQWVYNKRPTKNVSTEHYLLNKQALSTTLANNEVLLEQHYISVDPYMRIQQAASSSWEEPHPLNTVQQAGVVAKVLKSNSAEFSIGDWVSAYAGWQQYCVVHHHEIEKLNTELASPTTALGVLGMPGRTAWFGLMEVGKPKPSDTVFVSGAAGAVGSLVVQFAKKAGAKVVAFTGNAQKCQWLKQSLKADVVINYRDFEDYQALDKYLQQQQLSADVYFDNVGGLITDAVMSNLNLRARIIICGQMSQYNGQLDQVSQGPRFLQHMLYQRATIQGILARDYSHRMAEMMTVVAPWLAAGEIIYDETIVEGFAQLPEHLASLFTRKSHGKLMVKVK
jgi:NADPH-dependent curcumin reductase CurA